MLTALDLRDATWSASRSAPASSPATSAPTAPSGCARCVFIESLAPSFAKSAENPEGVDAAGVAGVQQAILDDRYAWLTGLLGRLPQPRRLPRHAGQRGDRARDAGTRAPRPRRCATWACPPGWLEDFSEDIERIDVPTLILHGTADRILPIDGPGPAAARRAARRALRRDRGRPAHHPRHPRRGGQPRAARVPARAAPVTAGRSRAGDATMFDGFAEHAVEHRRGPGLRPGRRRRTAAAAVARLSADPPHVACGGAAAGRAVHGRRADLPGYGASFRPAPARRSRPALQARAGPRLVEAMAALGHERFAVAGHDRGGRVAYRMALDHPERGHRGRRCSTSCRPARCGRAPTRALALVYWHWAFLAQPAPLPERLIAGDPDAFFDFHVRALGLGAAPGPLPGGAHGRLPAAARRPEHRGGDLRGLPRRRDASTASTTTPTAAAADRVPAARALERPRRAAAALRRRARRLAPLGARRERPRARRQPLPRRGPTRGRRRRAHARCSQPQRSTTHEHTDRRPDHVHRRDDEPQPRDELAGKLKRTELQHAASSIPGREIVQVLTEIPAGVGRAGTSTPARRSATSSPAPCGWRSKDQPTLTLHAGDPFLIPPRTPHNATRPRPGHRADALDLHRRGRRADRHVLDS